MTSIDIAVYLTLAATLALGLLFVWRGMPYFNVTPRGQAVATVFVAVVIFFNIVVYTVRYM